MLIFRSTNRVQSSRGWVDPAKLPRGPNGRALCRRCHKEVPKGRLTFCSAECVHQWRLRTSPQYLREQTWKRDHGICALCHQYTLAAMLERCSSRMRKRWEKYGWRGTGHLWQADHIKPVVEGGGECGLENIRTLCTACHKMVSKELAARRAEARKKG